VFEGWKLANTYVFDKATLNFPYKHFVLDQGGGSAANTLTCIYISVNFLEGNFFWGVFVFFVVVCRSALRVYLVFLFLGCCTFCVLYNGCVFWCGLVYTLCGGFLWRIW